jgi:hypothetical protein
MSCVLRTMVVRELRNALAGAAGKPVEWEVLGLSGVINL